MIETVLQTSGSDIISALNLIISGIAALAALMVLWFTSLKGPDISLVSSHSKIAIFYCPENTIVERYHANYNDFSHNLLGFSGTNMPVKVGLNSQQKDNVY